MLGMFIKDNTYKFKILFDSILGNISTETEDFKVLEIYIPEISKYLY